MNSATADACAASACAADVGACAASDCVPQKKKVTIRVKVKKAVVPSLSVESINSVESSLSVEKPAVDDAVVEPPKHSIWMSMRRRSRREEASVTPPPMFDWGAEDITDDEADEEGERERRQHVIEKHRFKVQQMDYEDQLYRLQSAGLFLDW
jgi:hypothetical protein